MRKSDLTIVAMVAIALSIGMLTGGRVSAAACDANSIGESASCPDTCGYPFGATGTPKQKTVFNESEVLRKGTTGGAGARVIAWYNDEHALTLGVRQVNDKKSKNSTITTNSPVSATVTGSCPIAPCVGDTTTPAGDDPAGRPIRPVLFITDLGVPSGTTTTLPCGGPTSPCPGDWQQQLDNSKGIKPSSIYGTWKAAVKFIDETANPDTITTTPDADPAKNNWSLPGAPDPVPAGLTNQGYGSEIVWNVNALQVNGGGLLASNRYRLQFMVHDGDQNKSGGDVGEACVVVSGIGNSCPRSDDTKDQGGITLSPPGIQLTGDPATGCVCPAGTDFVDGLYTKTTQPFSGTITLGSAVITSVQEASVSTTKNLAVGQVVSDSTSLNGIPAGAKIVSIDTVNFTVTLDMAATTSGSADQIAATLNKTMLLCNASSL